MIYLIIWAYPPNLNSLLFFVKIQCQLSITIHFLAAVPIKLLRMHFLVLLPTFQLLFILLCNRQELYFNSMIKQFPAGKSPSIFLSCYSTELCFHSFFLYSALKLIIPSILLIHLYFLYLLNELVLITLPLLNIFSLYLIFPLQSLTKDLSY